MCLNTFLCEICDFEIDQVFRMGDCDEEKSLAYNEKTGECQCAEVLIYRDEKCKFCKRFNIKTSKGYYKKMKQIDDKIKNLEKNKPKNQIKIEKLIESQYKN